MTWLLYPRLALTGIRKNRRFYLPYLLSCGGMVLMFYLIHDLAKKQGREEIWVSELVRRIHTPAPAVSRTLGSLEQKGYVRRAVDCADRRKTCVRVTPEGKGVLDGGFARFSDSCNGIFQTLGPDKSRQLIALLKELEAAMEAQELDGRAPPSA